MSNPSSNSLVGRHIIAEIGEPWDFESLAGSNELFGYIEAASSSASAKNWILCKISPFMHDGNHITTILAVKRYKNHNIIDELSKGKEISVNMVYDEKGGFISSADAEEMLRTQEHPFLIGTIKLQSLFTRIL